jgi:tyrosine-protein kinase Etk/Wzc
MEESNSSVNNNSDKERKRSNLNTESDPILFFYLLRKNLRWFVLIILLCVSLSIIYLRYTAPIYSSQLTYQVNSENRANTVLNVGRLQENTLAKDIEILKSKLLFKRALKRIPIDVSFFNQGEILSNELYRSSPISVDYEIKDSTVLGQSFFIKFINDAEFELTLNENLLGKFTINKKFNLTKVSLEVSLLRGYNVDVLESGMLFFRINSYESLTNGLNPKLSVFPLNQAAKTINISFKDLNPKKATDIVTAVAKEYMEYDIEERSKGSKKALEFIDTQLDRYYNKLKLSENKIKEFHEGNNYTTVDRSSAYFDRGVRLENELIDLELQLSVLKEIKLSISSNKGDLDVYDLLPILAGTEYAGGIMSLITNLKELLIQKENLQFEVTDNSEAVKSLGHRIQVQKKILFESINSSIEKLEVKRNKILEKTQDLQDKFKNVPEQELEYARLQRVLSIDEKFFTMLMERRTEYSISDAGFVSEHIILDRAIVPTVPISPNKIIFLGLGLALGLMFSLILLLIKYVLKNTISSVDEIIRQSYADIVVLGIVPKYKHDIPVSQLVVNKNPKSIIAESFRSIRSNMQFIDGLEGKKLLAVTSTVSGEGKTFCAINIAGIIAYSGKKVVILDLDMRKPKIHLGFGVENNVGMSTLLIKTNKIEDCIHHSELENLDFITSGPIPPNPSELIIGGELDNIIKELQIDYDFVIIDNPPIGLVSDAMELLKKADYPIYVFKNEYSKKYFVNNVDKLMLDKGINKLSVILNAVENGISGYGGGYGYGYEYGYGDYYEDEPNEKVGFIKGIFGRKK